MTDQEHANAVSAAVEVLNNAIAKAFVAGVRTKVLLQNRDDSEFATTDSIAVTFTRPFGNSDPVKDAFRDGFRTIAK